MSKKVELTSNEFELAKSISAFVEERNPKEGLVYSVYIACLVSLISDLNKKIEVQQSQINFLISKT